MNDKNKIINELTDEFTSAGATPSELARYQKIAQIIASEPEQEIPQNLIEKLKSKITHKPRRFSLPSLLLRAAAMFFLVFFTGLAIIQQTSRVPAKTTITPIANNNLEKINIVKAEKIQGEKISNRADKSYALDGSAASFSLTESKILAFPYTEFSHTNNYIHLNTGEIVVSTGRKKLRIVALDMRAELAPDSVAHFNMLEDKNEVQFTVLSGRSDVILADNRVHNFDAATDRKVMFYKKDFESPIFLKNAQDIEEQISIVKISSRKIAEVFKTTKILALMPAKSKNFTIEHLVQNSNSNSLNLIKRVEIDANNKKANIIKLNFQGKEEVVSLAQGDVISGWTLTKTSRAGLTFTKDSEEYFVPYSN